eukprot:jgi/Bigna1/85133/estExt_fgenesh1_pg.C_20265
MSQRKREWLPAATGGSGKRQRKSATDIGKEVDDLFDDDVKVKRAPIIEEVRLGENLDTKAESTSSIAAPPTTDNTAESLQDQLDKVNAILAVAPDDQAMIQAREQLKSLIGYNNNSGVVAVTAPTKEATWTPGMRCMVLWEDGENYPARIESVNGDNKAQVYFLQYGVNDTVVVDFGSMTPFKSLERSDVKEGSLVWAVWEEDGIMYKGKVAQILYGGCLVRFDEFDTEAEIDFLDIMARVLTPEEEEALKQKRKESQNVGSKRFEMRTGSHSIQGYNRSDPSKVNQDRRVELKKVPGEPQAAVFGVLDGHGEKGHHIAQESSKRIMESVGKQRQRLRRTPGKHIVHILEDVVAYLRSIQAAIKSGAARKNSHLDASHSGTTAVVTLKSGGRLYTANVGDSRCVLCRIKSNSPKGEDEEKGKSDSTDPSSSSSSSSGGKEVISALGMQLEIVPLSHDHKPDDPPEKKRITSRGGKVVVWPNQPARVFGSAGFGLAVSRSIGDFALHPYVVGDAELTEHQLSREDIFAIWASDGIWEYLGNAEVVRMIVESEALEKRNDLDTAARRLCNRARECWRAQTNGSYQDDITCVIVQFNELPGSAKRPLGLSRSMSDGIASTSTEVL